MKKFFSLLLASLIFLTAVPMAGAVSVPESTISRLAEEPDPASYLDYSISGGQVAISGPADGYTPSSLTIPAQIEGYPVTSISNFSFNDCTSLTDVILPDTVTTIGDFAFDACINLQSITISCNVTSIGKFAFDECSSLTSITIPDTVTFIGTLAFDACTSLKDVYYTGDIASWCGISFDGLYANPISMAETFYINNEAVTDLVIPDGVTSIGETAFYKYSGLKSVTIPDSVTFIGHNAFFECGNLENAVIGKGITSLDSFAFAYCYNLQSITLPDTVTSIGSWAFYRCDSLTDVYYTGSEEQFKAIQINSQNNCLTEANIHYSGSAAYLTAQEGSSAIIDEEAKMIYGLQHGLTEEVFENSYVAASSDVRLEYVYDYALGTGTAVKVISRETGELLDTYSLVIFGDLNGDGYVDVFDQALLTAAANYETAFEADSAYEKAAELSGDGVIDVFDLSVLTAAANGEIIINQVSPF